MSCWVPSFRFGCTKRKKFLLFLKRNKRTDFYYLTHLTKMATSSLVRYLISGSVKTKI
jgi:hypothetical protein